MKTLADMTPDERHECVGMWCEITLKGLGRVNRCELGVIRRIQWDGGHGAVEVIGTDSSAFWNVLRFDQITPRFDLPRAWGTDGSPAKRDWKEVCE